MPTYVNEKGIMEKKMQTAIVYWGFIGMMEKKMEASMVLGLHRDDGTENGSYYAH